MDLKVLSSAIAGVNAAFSAVSGIVRVTIDVETKRKLSEVVNMLIDAQNKLQEANAATTAIQRRVTELEDDQKRVEDFRAEKARYRAIQKGPGAFVYAEKEVGDGEAATPELCANCFHQEVKSFVQLARYTPGGRIFSCARCKAEILVPLDSAGVTIETAGPRRSIFDDYTR